VSPRLFLRIASTEARKRLSYRADFWIQALGVLAIEAGIYWFLWHAVFRESGRAEIGGFSLHGIILYSIAAQLLARSVRGIEFEHAISQDVYDGGLNRYIVYPTAYFGFKYAQHLGGTLPVLVQLIVFGSTFPFLLGLDPSAAVTPASAAMALVSLAVANLLYFLIAYPLQGVAFWADNVWSLIVTQRFVTSILGGAMLPLTLFPDGVKAVLDLSPFPALFWVPVMTLLGRMDPAEWARNLAVALAWCGALALLGRSIFRRGYLQYSGVGI
jgi:ABC-2 type transport system permease protein